MPPIRSREGLAFPRDVLSEKQYGHPEEKQALPESRWEAYHSIYNGGLTLSR